MTLFGLNLKVAGLIYSNPNNPSWICLNEDELRLLEDLLEQKRQAVALEAQEELSIVRRAEADITEALMTETEWQNIRLLREIQSLIEK